MKRIAIFASGSGSNAQRITEYFSSHKLIEVTLFLCNKPSAFVFERAKNMNKTCILFSKNDLESGVIKKLLNKYRIDWVILAGFLLKIPDSLIEMYPQRILNIHPALLPKYGGKGMYGEHVHNAVISNREKESGITIHYVNTHYDEGKIIFQAKVDVKADDTPEMLASKIHLLEHTHYPVVIEKEIMSENCI